MMRFVLIPVLILSAALTVWAMMGAAHCDGESIHVAGWLVRGCP